MGVIGSILGSSGAVSAVGDVAKGLAEVFTPSATRKQELSTEAQMAALKQFGDEFALPATNWFDTMVNGLNRLPRPLLAFGTIGLFVYAMIDPARFGKRMVGLNLVPEALWWLLGAVVAFYFGAREAHYFRTGPVAVAPAQPAVEAASDGNAALDDWQQSRG